MAEARQLRAFAAVFPVKDVVRARAFFVEQLAFREEFRWGEDPLEYAGVEREAVAIHLMRVERDLALIGRSSVYVFVADVNSLHEEFKSRGCAIEVAPADFPYGMREMSVRDPDGNRLTFGQPVTPTA